MSDRIDRREETVACHRRAVERVIGAMHERLYEGFTLEQMAEEGYMSPYHFNRVFRQATGVPPVQFFSGLRLRQAKRLLVDTSASVTDVCFEVGYSSLGTFTRRFGELVGVSPGRFREIARAAGEEGAPPLPLIASAAPVAADQRGPGVFGHVRAEVGDRGPVFVGLFPAGVPQGRPVACTVLAEAGPFRLLPHRDGRYHLMVAGLGVDPSPLRSLLCEDALRGRSAPVDIVGGYAAAGPVSIELRAPREMDPPILLTLPVLIREHLASRGGSEHAEPARRAV